MKIVVFGVGGVGGYFGGKLAKAGFDVTFIARGKHMKAIRNNGLHVKSIHGDFKVHPNVTDDISTIETPDVIILGVKSWQIKDIARQIKPILGDHTLVLPLQNGADNADQLRTVLDDKYVLAGLCKIVARIESPGVIDHFAHDPEIVFGEYNNERTERLQKLEAVFNTSDIKNKIPNDIHLDIWRKFLFITTISGIGALTRAVIGITRTDENIRKMMYQTANEIVAVANTKGIALKQDDVDLVFKVVDNLAYKTTASMQRDIMEGRPSELENFNGYIVKQGKELDISTPINSFTYNSLLPQEKMARS